MHLVRWAALVTPLLVSFCGGGSTQGGADAAGGRDGATAETDSDSGSGSGTATAASCAALAETFKTNCADNTERVCLWTEYVRLCAVGRTQLLFDSMRCLDLTVCRVFSDPNEGAACLAAVHGAEESTAAKAFLEKVCAPCGPSCPSTSGQAEVYPYLSDDDLAALGSCNLSACAPSTSCPALADIAPLSSCSSMLDAAGGG